MKKILSLVILTAILTVLGNQAVAQTAGWRMLLNNDHSAFNIHIYNNEMTFYFDPKTDTLTFSQSNNKPIKDNITVEFTLRNSKKVLFATNEKNLAAGKMQIVVALSDVYKAAMAQKLPSKPKFTLSIMDRTTVKEKISFEFRE